MTHRRIIGLMGTTLLLAACGTAGTEEPDRAASTSTTTTTTSTAPSSTTTTTSLQANDLDEGRNFNASQKLTSQTTYRLNIEGLATLVMPPTDGWRLFTYQSQGEVAGALMGWRGPGGFRDGTLNILVFDLGVGVESAWDRIEAMGETAAWGPWTWIDQGTALVGGREAQWQEARTPDLPGGEEGPISHSLVSGLAATVWANSSIKFYVIPIDDLTITLVAFENRCTCLPSPLPNHIFGAQMADDEENELEMWIPELEAFLANLSFEES